jgi:hypothetical protein
LNDSIDHILILGEGLKGFLSSFNINKKIPNRESTIMPYIRNLGLWPDDDQYGPMELKGSKLGFLSLFTINIKFLIDRVPSCHTFEIWDFGRIGE